MPDLARKTLGRTGLEVTALGYGAMELRGEPRGPAVSDEDASRILNAVLDAGINFIDTSPDYGNSEEHIGRSISPAAASTFSPRSAAARSALRLRQPVSATHTSSPLRTSAPGSNRASGG